MKNKFNPYIQLLPYPVNSFNDDIEDDDNANPIYHVIVSQGELSFKLIVVHKEPDNNTNIEYEVVRASHLVIRSVFKGSEDSVVLNGKLSSDISFANETFKHLLEPFGIRLNKINVHNYSFIESNREGFGFVFENDVILNELKRRVNEKCRKMMGIVKVNQS